MNVADLNMMAALPEMVLLGLVSIILVLDLFISDAKRGITYALSLATLAICALIQVVTYQPFSEMAFSGMFVDDPLSDIVKLGMYGVTAVVLVLTRQYIETRALFRGEYFTLTLFALLGMNIMVSSSHFLTLYLGLELLSLSMYALIALQRDSIPAVEAAMKYFVLGALASGLLLYGMSMIYGATGTLYLAEMASKIHSGTANTTLLVFGTVFIVTGLGFKLGVVPFHMWVPDIYEGSPTAITLMIGAAPKLAAFVFVFRILVQGLGDLVQDWQGMLTILAVLSMALGNITAIAQTNIKRMFAYSTISHMGFLLLGLIAGTQTGYSASLFYVFIYVLMSTVGFGILMVLSRKGFECENLDDLKGLNSRNSTYAFLMLLALFSMAGIPPLAGFYAKFAVISAIVSQGMNVLAVYAVLMSLIGAFYYLRAVKVMYFDDPSQSDEIETRVDVRLVLTIAGLALLVIGIVPESIVSLCIEALQLSMVAH